MEKHKTLLLCLLTGFFAISCLFLSSCSDDPFNNERSHERNALDKKTERLLKQDYWQYLFSDIQRSVLSVDDVRIDYYLGTYNGCVVFANLRSNGYGHTSINGYGSISIYGYDFVFPTSFEMYAWKKGANTDKGSFYNLYYKDSLESVSLTKNDAEDMYKRYLAYKIIITNEDFYPGAFEGLNEKTKRQIKLDWWQDIYDDWWRDIYTFFDHSIVKDVWIDYYLGTYNGYVIIAVLRNSRWTSRIILNGYEFIFPSDFSLYAWKQDSNESGHFYRILNEQDFNVLSLTLYDMEKMYERYLTFNILDDIRLTSNVFNGLEAETAWQIKSNFTQGYFPDDFQIHFYLGRYNDYSVFIILNQNPAMSFLHVGDFSLRFAYGSNAYAWKQDKESKSGKLYIVGKSAGVIERIDSDDFISSDDAISIYKQYLRFYNEGI